MKTPPEILYLQFYGSDEGDVASEPEDVRPEIDLNDVSWWAEPIHDADIKYVRADLSLQESEELAADIMKREQRVCARQTAELRAALEASQAECGHIKTRCSNLQNERDALLREQRDARRAVREAKALLK